MYATFNYKTKTELRKAVAAGHGSGIFQPGPFGGDEPENGEVTLEGPHFPEAHRWYARALVQGGRIVKVLE